MKTNLAAWVSTLCLVTGIAEASESGTYLDFSIGKSDIKNLSKASLDSDVTTFGTLNSSSLKDKDAYGAVAIGYRFTQYLAAEVGWTYLGAQTYTANFSSGANQYEYKSRLVLEGVTAATVGILPIGKRFELRGRGGLFFSNAVLNRDITGPLQAVNESFNETSTELFVSVGAAYKFTPKFSIFLSAHHFNKVGADDIIAESNVDGASLGVTFRQ